MSVITEMRKKEIFSIDKSYLYFNFQCLTVLGIWNPYKKGLKYWFYQGYWAYVMHVITAMRLATTLVRGINAETSMQFLQEFSALAIQTADTITYMAFWFHRVDVLELSEAFNWERHLSSTHEITRYRNKVLTAALNSSKTFTIALVVALIQYFSFSFYSTFCESDYKVERLPIGTAPMRYHFILTNFWVAFICDFITFTFLGLIAVVHDAFIMSVMINVKAQLKILNFRLKRCHMTSSVVHSDRSDDENSYVVFFECLERQKNVESLSLYPNEELINCIKFHQQIVRIVKIFKKIYSTAFLPQLFTSMVLITVLLLQIILAKDSNHADAIIALGFLIPVILQLLTFCWGGNIILVESEKSSNSLYKSDWYGRDKEFRGNVEIFLGALRRPIVVSAGNLYDLSAVTFKNVLSKAYSGVAVLKNMST